MDDAYLAELHREIARLGLQQAIVFAGHHEQIAPFYALADAFLLPSFWEGWSLALAEAVYMGLPVIATAVGSAPDLLPQVGGRLIRPVFDSILDLDVNTLSGYLSADRSRLTADLTGAMKALCDEPRVSTVSQELRDTLDRQHAYGLHARLFTWLLAGGDVPAARSWTRPPGR
jgi:glycosyltransferase involved in cell wall biosynthesis